MLSFLIVELKQALKQLENNHPGAYDEFVRTLHPAAGAVAVVKPSQVRKPCRITSALNLILTKQKFSSYLFLS